MSPFKSLNVFLPIFIRTTESASVRKNRILLQKADCFYSRSEVICLRRKKGFLPFVVTLGQSVTNTIPSQS